MWMESEQRWVTVWTLLERILVWVGREVRGLFTFQGDSCRGITRCSQHAPPGICRYFLFFSYFFSVFTCLGYVSPLGQYPSGLLLLGGLAPADPPGGSKTIVAHVLQVQPSLRSFDPSHTRPSALRPLPTDTCLTHTLLVIIFPSVLSMSPYQLSTPLLHSVRLYKFLSLEMFDSSAFATPVALLMLITHVLLTSDNVDCTRTSYRPRLNFSQY